MARRGRRPKDPTPILWQAAEVERLARKIIPVHHKHLEGRPITYAFAPRTLKARGRAASGKCEIVGGKTAAFARGLPKTMAPVDGEERFFLITMAWPVWVNLTDAQKEALTDHELSHAGLNDKGNLTIWPHDLEEFAAIVERHGLWEHGVRKFAEACASAGQLGLPLSGAEGGENAPPEKPNGGRRKKDGGGTWVEFNGEKGELGTAAGEKVIEQFVETAIAETQRPAAGPN